MVVEGRSNSTLNRPYTRAISLAFDCPAFWGAAAGSTNGTDHVLVFARLRLRVSTRPGKLPTSRLNDAALEVLEKRRALSTATKTKSNINDTAPTDEVSVGNQWNTLETVIKEAAWKELGKISKQLQDWVSATTRQLSFKIKEVHLSGSLEYRRLQRAATRSARIDHKRYSVRMAEEMEATSRTGDFGKLFRLIHSASDEHYKIQFDLRGTTG